MATTQLLSVAEYLRTSYEPDAEYVDGQIEERQVGEYDHAKLQFDLAFVLRNTVAGSGIEVLGEVRVQVGPRRFRVPDICLLPANSPREQIIRTAPLLCIEILSPQDTLSRMRVRAQDFLDMGVREVWVLDPRKRVAYVCSGNTMSTREDGLLALSGTAIQLSLERVFSVLD